MRALAPRARTLGQRPAQQRQRAPSGLRTRHRLFDLLSMLTGQLLHMLVVYVAEVSATGDSNPTRPIGRGPITSDGYRTRGRRHSSSCVTCEVARAPAQRQRQLNTTQADMGLLRCSRRPATLGRPASSELGWATLVDPWAVRPIECLHRSSGPGRSRTFVSRRSNSRAGTRVAGGSSRQ